MTLYLSLERAHRLIRRGPWYAAVGAFLMVFAVWMLRDFGWVSGLMLFLFGLCGVSFRYWLQERGLWMLAVVCLCMSLLLYVVMQWDAIRRVLKGPNPRHVWLAVDVAFAAWIVLFQVRLLATVVRFNRMLSPSAWRPERDEGPSGVSDP
jgi:hypothetical protein